MKVLFVCTGNAFRGPVAEALLKKLKPKIEVDSAGTRPSTQISEDAKKYLTRENAEQYLKNIPKGLDSKQLNTYDFIIVMEPKHEDIVLSKCPECKDKILVWNIDDPYFLPAGYTERIFKQIRNKVAKLANSFQDNDG